MTDSATPREQDIASSVDAGTDPDSPTSPADATTSGTTPPVNESPAKRPNGWHFPELEGPDLSTELVPGEADLWVTLETQSISDIWGLDLDEGEQASAAKAGKRAKRRKAAAS